jgi:hypothetical protein
MATMSTPAKLICGGLQPTAAPVETFARFLGITPLQLRARLQRRATGQPAE